MQSECQRFTFENMLKTLGICSVLTLRLNINNVNYASLKVKRDRAIKYWKQRVIQNFLPPIDFRKREELNERVLKLKHQIDLNRSRHLQRHLAQTPPLARVTDTIDRDSSRFYSTSNNRIMIEEALSLNKE